MLVSSAGSMHWGDHRSRSAPSAKFCRQRQGTERSRPRSDAGRRREVIFSHALTPAQERNLERLFQCRVVDRTGLILDIFAQRAALTKASCGSELAQLRHLSTRLVRGWTHLEATKGGSVCAARVKPSLKPTVACCVSASRPFCAASTRWPNSGNRAPCPQPQRGADRFLWWVYTNAGKSTLFNQLQMPACMPADQLFATLDLPCANW